MAVLNTNFTNLTTYPNSFSRQEPTPLEAHSLFTSVTAAKDYAKNNPVAYVGQIIVVIDATNKVCTPYVISDTTGALGEIGGNIDLGDYVTGPSSSTDHAVARYDGTTGKIIQNSSGVTIDDNNKLKINATDTGGQSNVFQALSTSASDNNANWIGRSLMGSKTLTFLMGTYKSMAAVGAHSWTDANAGSGAAWAPMYFQPDGGASAAIYMGQNGSGWTANTGTLIIKGSATANAGTVDVNGTLTATTVKKTGGADTHVLLAGGGTKPLSEFGISGDSAGNFTAPITITTDATGGTVVNAINITTSTRSGTAMKVIPYDKNGTGIILGDGGIFLAGSGESATNLWNDVLKNSASGGSENTYITSDGSIFLVSNCNTVANCKQVEVNGSGVVSASGFKILSGGTWQYNSTTDCVELVW